MLITSKFPLPSLLVVVLGLLMFGCEQHSTPEPTPAIHADTPYATVWVSAEGQILLNGKPADFAAADSALVALAEQQGIVLYGRDTAAGDPHPSAAKLIQLIGGKGLPIRASIARDFSDVTSPDGKLIQ